MCKPAPTPPARSGRASSPTRRPNGPTWSQTGQYKVKQTELRPSRPSSGAFSAPRRVEHWLCYSPSQAATAAPPPGWPERIWGRDLIPRRVWEVLGTWPYPPPGQVSGTGGDCSTWKDFFSCLHLDTSATRSYVEYGCVWQITLRNLRISQSHLSVVEGELWYKNKTI